MKRSAKLLSVLLVFCLLAALVPAIVLGAGGTPSISLSADVISAGDTVYMGDYYRYAGSPYSSLAWTVLDTRTNTGETGLFLLSQQFARDGAIYFDKDAPFSNQWQGSYAQLWCKAFYRSGVFTSTEQNAILATTKSDSTFSTTVQNLTLSFSAVDNILNNEHVFFLSAEEAAAYSSYLPNGISWLRSPYASSTGTSVGVLNSQQVNAGDVNSPTRNSRPAMNLNTGAVLFYSNTAGGKDDAVDSDLTAVGAGGSSWKLTLLDSSRNFTVDGNPTSISAAAGGDISLNYSGAGTGQLETVSVIIADSSGNALYYGAVAGSSASGTATFSIPAALADGSYTLKVFSETRNAGYMQGSQSGDTMTDYASAFVNIPLIVSSAVPSPSPSATPSPSVSASPSPSPSAAATPSPTPSATVTPSPTPSASPSPSPSASPSAEPSPTASATVTPSPAPSDRPSPSAAPSDAPSPSPTLDPNTYPPTGDSENFVLWVAVFSIGLSLLIFFVGTRAQKKD
ncbi:MAG: hypothetical protein IJC35_03275 [Oscillospiraceae bacterium]|nr:hypothetical protein [Oscillospiraceae bacterium]